jgi:hypothetical protein
MSDPVSFALGLVVFALHAIVVLWTLLAFVWVAPMPKEWPLRGKWLRCFFTGAVLIPAAAFSWYTCVLAWRNYTQQ